MTETMISFINGFLLPLISVYIYWKRGKEKLLFTFENVCLYSVFLTVGIICNKAITSIIKTMFLIQIDMNSSYFTLVGLFTFVLYCIPSCFIS